MTKPKLRCGKCGYNPPICKHFDNQKPYVNVGYQKLSDKIVDRLPGEYGEHLETEDVKQFIKNLKKGYAKGDSFIKKIDKLAGPKLK